jgi:hypothetical protein
MGFWDVSVKMWCIKLLMACHDRKVGKMMLQTIKFLGYSIFRQTHIYIYRMHVYDCICVDYLVDICMCICKCIFICMCIYIWIYVMGVYI